MNIGIISLFPKMFYSVFCYGIINRALRNGVLSIQYWNPRDFISGKYRKVDDRPYGGGPGMLMLYKPLKQAINAAKDKLGFGVKVIYLSPQGKRLNYQMIRKFVSDNLKLILICGRYEGIDERLIFSEVDEELSIGDYILTGGELAAMVFIDVIVRLLPGVLGNNNSILSDSFINNILNYPQYTRPKLVDGIEVPSVLLSGNHTRIHEWRLKQSLGRTWLRRPDLLNKIRLDNQQRKLLSEFQNEFICNLNIKEDC